MALWLLACLLAMPARAHYIGDANGDNEINIADINTIVNVILTDGYAFACDANQDGEVNISDVNKVVNIILGAEETAPTYSGTLPVMFINIDGGTSDITKETYLWADWWIDDLGLEGYESIGSEEDPHRLQIKGRGNITWRAYDKKPYRIKFEQKEKPLGMKKNRHFCLMAHADDWAGFTRDAVGFELSRRIGLAWTPTEKPVEVVLNGQYLGLYFLAEKIRVGKNRVDITEQADNEAEAENITGGWLLEFDNMADDNTLSFYENDTAFTNVTYHSPEQLSSEQRQYLSALINTTDSLIYLKDKSSRAWEQYIDLDSLACYYIVNEIMDVLDAFNGSCYIHKERGNNTKLIFGPVWDFGFGFYRAYVAYYWGGDTTMRFFYDQDITGNHWIKEIVKFPHFQSRVSRHWKKFYVDLDKFVDEFMDEYTQRIAKAGEADYQRWPLYNGEGIIDRYEKIVKPYLHKRIAWLNEQWGE